jgi:hypothetical protein
MVPSGVLITLFKTQLFDINKESLEFFIPVIALGQEQNYTT